MNRLMLMTILFDTIKLYCNNELNFITFFMTLENVEYQDYDPDKCIYVQTLLIHYLFEHFPYYRILDVLDEIGDYLLSSTAAFKEYNAKAIVINGCILELLPDIKRRIKTETMQHLLELLERNYKGVELTDEELISLLGKNICQLNLLTGLDFAENYNYYQNHLPGIDVNEAPLNERVSRQKSIRKESITKELNQYTLSHYDERSIEEFMTKLYDKLETLSIPDRKSLEEEITQVLNKLYMHCVIAWSEKDNDDYQLSLTF